MSGAYVHIVVGDFDILVDARSVLEVSPSGGRSADGGGCRPWRAEALPVVDGRTVLGFPDEAEPGTSVVLGQNDGSRFFLDITAVKGVRRLEDDRFRPLPPLPEGVGRLFDGVLLEENGRFGLRLRGDADFLAGAAAPQ